MLGLHIFLTGQHLVIVAPDRVDLSVMDDKTVGMSPFPAGIGVGGKTGMHDCNS